MNIVCDQPTPTEEGKYIWIPELTKEAEMITVIYIPPHARYGMGFDGYYGVREFRGRNVAALRGRFSRKLSFS